MKRKSIQHVHDLSLKDQVSLFQEASRFKGWVGDEKVDGVFLSVGLDENNDFFFQTANSPRCRTWAEYQSWCSPLGRGGGDAFFDALKEFVCKMMNSTHFMKYLHVEKANRYPLSFLDLSFEWLSKDLAERRGGGTAVYIRVPYTYVPYDRLIAIGHTPPDLIGYIRIIDGISVERNTQTSATWNYDTSRIGEILSSSPRIEDSRTLSLKPLRDELRAELKSLWTTCSFKYDVEGIVFLFRKKKVKIINPKFKSLPLNKNMFKGDA